MRALLANYVKYAALVRFQEEALEEEDLDRFEDLAEAREAMQEELGDEPPPFPDPAKAGCREPGVLRAGLRELQGCPANGTHGCRPG